jgi:hypothetical protein
MIAEVELPLEDTELDNRCAVDNVEVCRLHAAAGSGKKDE